MLNQFDSCCFRGIRFLTYEDIVKDFVTGLRRGRYDVFLDSTHTSHVISLHALERGIFPFLKRRGL